MGYVIAIAGKGGTGKTTVAALLARIIRGKTRAGILAVDADPNSNLAEALGVKEAKSIGLILDEIARDPSSIPAGMPKDRFIEYRIQEAIIETEDFDLLTMGKPEGPGCYCYVNNVLRGIVAKLIKDYAYIIIDNEAGLEHLSRRTTRAADTLLVVSDATTVGLKAAKRIKELVNELQIQTGKNFLVINRYNTELKLKKFTDTGLDYLGGIPEDEEIKKISLDGGSLLALNQEAASISALRKIGERIWLKN